VCVPDNAYAGVNNVSQRALRASHVSFPSLRPFFPPAIPPGLDPEAFVEALLAMEALVAVGLAGNVVQFVQFAGELISETIAIRKTGSPSSLPKLQNLAANLTKQAGLIKAHLDAARAVEELAQEDQVSPGVPSDGTVQQTHRNYSSLILFSTCSTLHQNARKRETHS